MNPKRPVYKVVWEEYLKVGLTSNITIEAVAKALLLIVLNALKLTLQNQLLSFF
jgi:hypothetical protein